MYHYELYGAGLMAQAVGFELMRNCEASRITVVEPDGRRCLDMSRRMRALIGAHAGKITYHQEIERVRRGFQTPSRKLLCQLDIDHPGNGRVLGIGRTVLPFPGTFRVLLRRGQGHRHGL